MIRDHLEEQRRRSEMTTAQQDREDRAKNLLETIARSKDRMNEQGLGALIKISMPRHAWDDISGYLNLGIAAQSLNNARLMGAEVEITYRSSQRYMELDFESGHRHIIPVYQSAAIYPAWEDIRNRYIEEPSRVWVDEWEIDSSNRLLNVEALNRLRKRQAEWELTNERTRAQIPAPDKIPTY